MTTSLHEIYALNEKSVTVVLGNEISADLANKVANFNRAITAKPFAGFITTVPAYTTVTLFYDPLMVSKSNLRGSSNFEKVANYVKTLNMGTSEIETLRNKVIIPVCYGNQFGPDIDFVSRQSDLSPTELIKIHSAATYIVHMIGFVPGFAYMGGMDKRLATPRKSIPRSSVDAGAVGIAGEQTGIYSLNTPGGWQIIGRTPLRLFDPERKQASLLKAGDEVIFESISVEEFNALS